MLSMRSRCWKRSATMTPMISTPLSFIYCGAQGSHVCIVFPMLGYSLLTHLKQVGTFLLSEIAEIAWQMGKGLNYLHEHLHIIHTDLKPENILLDTPRITSSGGRRLIAPKSMGIRIIDFGGSTPLDHKSMVVSTRPYRAPEVLLGECWGEGIDMWSVGCILAELHTGNMLLRTGVGGDDREHLAMMEQLLGPMPKYYADAPANTPEQPLFDAQRRLDKSWLKEAPQVFEVIYRLDPLPLMGLDSDFLDLLVALLDFNTSNRLTAHELMRHTFVLDNYTNAERFTLMVQDHEQASFGEVLGAPYPKVRADESALTDSSCGWTSSGPTSSPVTLITAW
eukprot:Hpha_TRINITY_DN30633_c0_g1::TRINITY_DN30633_c0_g1_i1::g.18251::m.18251